MLFYKVLQNLISNSLKFLDDSRNLKVEITSSEEKERFVFSVRDNGVGFDSEYHDFIFEMLKQLKTKNKTEGSGIGLALCKRLVENLGGEIWAESKKGEGSTFYFSIPK